MADVIEEENGDRAHVYQMQFSSQNTNLEPQGRGNADVTDNIYQLQHCSAERTELENQVIKAFKEKDIKRLKKLVLPTSKTGCPKCNCGQADMDWKKMMTILRGSRGSERENTLCTFKMLVRDLPEVADKVLSGCVTCMEVDSKEFKTVYEVDYLFLEEYSCEQEDDEDEECGDEIEQKEDEGPMQVVIDEMQSSVFQYKVKRTSFNYNHTTLELIGKCDLLLTHPVVMSYLRRKWKKYLALCYFLNLGLYLFFLCCFTTFALTVHNPLDPVCKGANETIITNETSSDSTNCDLSPGRRGVVTIVGLCTIVFSCIRLLMEFFELINFHMLVTKCRKTGKKGRRISTKMLLQKCIHWKYFKKPQNYLEIPLYFLSLYFSFVLYNKCFCPDDGVWQAGIVAILFAWLNLLHFFNKWPLIGKYIAMFEAILVRFMKVLIIAVVLLVAFSLAFFMALHEPNLPDTPFENPEVTMVETISQAIGGPDFSIFRLLNDDTHRSQVPNLALSFIIWILFGVCISVLFITFLTALAVHDVNELKLYGKKKRTELMITLFMEVENLKRVLQLCVCCRRCFSKSKNTSPVHMEMATLNHERSATRSEGPSFDSVTPHSKTRIFTSVLGVDNIDYILSDLEDVSMM